MWEYPSAVVHAKIVVADDTVQFGTLNLDAWALYRDFELGMVVDGRGNGGIVRVARVRAGHRPLAAGSSRRRGVWDRSTAWLWDKVTYFL